jgi:hypothetical protein
MDPRLAPQAHEQTQAQQAQPQAAWVLPRDPERETEEELGTKGAAA